jgi:hypothetical protein
VPENHLHPNRPSDQLSWRTPSRNVVHDISPAAALVAEATPVWSPLEGDASANKIPAQSETESPAKLADNEPQAPTHNVFANALH